MVISTLGSLSHVGDLGVATNLVTPDPNLLAISPTEIICFNVLLNFVFKSSLRKIKWSWKEKLYLFNGSSKFCVQVKFWKTQVVLHVCLVSVGILYHHHGNKFSPITTKTSRVARSSLRRLTDRIITDYIFQGGDQQLLCVIRHQQTFSDQLQDLIPKHRLSDNL